MATSLAEQLQRLAVPQTSVLKHSKKKTSFLFEPKEAAGIKRDTFYQIGLEGLEELIEKNAVFEEFARTLFHFTSKEFERSVQTPEDNKKLDKSIKRFLLLLSPYFLLRCAHKALEWLVNRFSIHEYNRNDLLKLILPYHESNLFVRMLQLLKFKDSRDSFYFLKKLQKPGVHLPKQGLLNHASSNSGFLKFVTEFVLQLLKVHDQPALLSVAFNFYCAVFTGAVEFSNEVNEDQISQMLPLLLAGLNSPVEDFCAASYVITARLLTKTKFSDKLLNKFVEKITNLKAQSLKMESCIVLLVLYQSQSQYSNLPQGAIANLSEREWLPKYLYTLNNAGSYIYPFLERLLKRSTEEGVINDSKLARDLVKNCLNEIKIDDKFVADMFQSILDILHFKIKYPEEIQDWLTEILQIFERQYPVVFDKQVYLILSSTSAKKGQRKRKCLSKILKNTLTYKKKFDIFERLYHPSASLRSTAIIFIQENYESLSQTDQEIIKGSLIDRLNDENVMVVEETLSVFQKVTIVDPKVLKDTLIILAHKCKRDQIQWGSITNKVINMLTSNSTSEDWEVFLCLFPFLLPYSIDDLKLAKKLFKKKFFGEHPLFSSCIDEIKKINNPANFVKLILDTLKNNVQLDYLQKFVKALKQKNEKRCTIHEEYISLLILSSILPENSEPEIGALILDSLFYPDHSKMPRFSEKSTITAYIEATVMGKYPVQGYLECFESIINKTKIPAENFLLSDFSQLHEGKRFFLLMSKLLFDGGVLCKPCLKKFLNRFFANWHTKIIFLLNLCVSENTILGKNFVSQVLNYLNKALFDISEDEKKLFFDFENIIAVLLLILLYSSNKEIRVVTLNTLEHISSISKRGTSYNCLINELLKYKEEMIMDEEQVPTVVSNNLDPFKISRKKQAASLNRTLKNLLELICKQDTSLYVKVGILKIVSDIHTPEILEQVAEVSLKIAMKESVWSDFEEKIVKYTCDRIQSQVIHKMNLNTYTWKFIECCIRQDKTVLFINEVRYHLSPLVLNQLHKECFAVLDDVVVKKLLGVIIEVASVSQNLEVAPVANRIFKHIDLNANFVLDQLIQMQDVRSPKLDLNKKRISVIPTVDILDTLEWKRGVYILEVIQDKKKIQNFTNLLQVMFNILKKCLDFDEQAPVEYTKQLLLSSIQHCCEKSEEPLPDKLFNVELIVQCIRASQNPQTHHYALLVLAQTAHLIPNQVLHHMMAIFTFMGSSILRHDDAYSFQIITKIIDTVIPILIKEDKEIHIAKVLKVFVDVLLDVPEHRKLPLYKQLIEKINAKENLYLFLLLVIESQVVHRNQSKKEDGQKRLDIAANLCLQFSPDIVLHTFTKLMKYLSTLPDEHEDSMEVDGTEIATFNIASHTAKQFRHYKYLLLKFINNFLKSHEFINKIAALDRKQELALETLFKGFIIANLQYIQRVLKVAEKSARTPQAQYWKTILHLSYDVLDLVNALVTAEMFLLITKGLIVHNVNAIKKRILELFNSKLQYNPQFFADCDQNEMILLIQPLVSIIETLETEESLPLEQETIIQTALLSMKLLVKYLAQNNPEKIVPILEFIIRLINSGKAQNNILASLLLCMAELCVNLKVRAIPSLPEFMPAILKVLKQQRRAESPSVLLRSIITALEKIIDTLPLFLNPYLQKLLFELSLLISKWDSDAEKLQPFVSKINSIKFKIGSVLPLRVLLTPIEECYHSLVKKSYHSAIGALMDILAENIKNLKGPDVNSNLPELSNFFLNALKFRVDCESSLEANKVENHIVKTLTVLILKLSESSFKPLYYKLYDWAVRSEEKSERLITFYHLSSSIAQSLKGLFVLFASHIVNNVAEIIDSCNNLKTEKLYFQDEAKTILLLEYVLQTLNSVFLYDTHKFTNKDRFDIIMQPLVDQLENTMGGVDEATERNTKLLIPCLVSFTLALADDSLWKQMNYQILLKMRHTTPKIRLTTLNCLTEIVRKLGEDFLPLLPETIPFLAELLEDEEEEIEKACQKAVQEMEKVLGEPLRKYF